MYEAVVRVCVVGAGASDIPAAPQPLPQTKGLTSASPGQGNLQDTSGPGGEGLAQDLRAGGTVSGVWIPKQGLLLLHPGAVQREECCERELGMASVGCCSGVRGNVASV